MDEILQKKSRERRNEIPVCFTVELKKPTNTTYLEVDFSALCEDNDVCFLKVFFNINFYVTGC